MMMVSDAVGVEIEPCACLVEALPVEGEIW